MIEQPRVGKRKRGALREESRCLKFTATDARRGGDTCTEFSSKANERQEAWTLKKNNRI